MTITINAILKANPGKEESLREELIKVVQASRNEEGCISYTLHESTENPETFVFYEKWRDEDALNRHIDSQHYKAYRKNIETLVQNREVYRLNVIDL
ncbi:putative quinol monooxygenase [Fictibacillus phosphorivorans]|uniref:putative quinol monooxygenase n=1 Tax=Fictibacillus phosphorivorans TaxID=1221500 RepID=UPI0012930658|nr:putative quinol monooxygenase [Fictibacillus phosphorivorans]MQR97485.1 antibiotic biosynthesis monooxygenase [Fictibacillus phosphorivorans]